MGQGLFFLRAIKNLYLTIYPIENIAEENILIPWYMTEKKDVTPCHCPPRAEAVFYLNICHIENILEQNPLHKTEKKDVTPWIS